ncbi:Response regulator receiver domain-containing protein [Roseateles sp. YR242]|uniref:response regulator n=1 Tax=Roseateles sp. YR242 TaxID=1855305 RepID=UPI0008AE16BF|nr:response regulator [Roseateles sp. YR242]SEK80620.1 Response regulator receiver domain-containing protein [Roseateles sp. YR242]
MPFELPEYLQPFLLPLLIAVPLAVLIWIITVRRGDHRDLGVPPPAARPHPDDRRGPPSGAPASTAARAPVTPRVEAATPAGRLPLLLVDDSAVVRAKLLKLFQEAGYEAQAARDGTEALELMSKTRFGVLLTDLEMPNMDGFELIKSVQGSMETEDLPIIAITGHEELHARLHQIQGLYGMFHKPWNDRELLKRVEALAHMRRAEA